MTAKKKTQWYVGGLAFQCLGCGSCCAGPDEGYIWTSRHEVDMLAEHLGLSIGEVRKKHLIRVGTHTSITEQTRSKDCVFLKRTNVGRSCAIYPVRPNQCRTWPFWSSNLSSSNDWNRAAMKCPGINRGQVYSFDQIEKLKKQKRWWDD